MTKLNFADVEEFVPVPVGRYLAEVKKSAEGVSDRAGQRKWSLQLEVTEDPQHEGEFVGKTIKWDISLQKQALWKVKQTLGALGEEVSAEDANFEFDAEAYLGRKVTMVVTMQHSDEYGDRTRVQQLQPAAAMQASA